MGCGLAFTINHSLAWLQNRLILAGCMASLISPLSYLAAQRLGALTIITDSLNWFFGLALSWAVVLPLLLWLAGYLREINAEQCDG